MEATGKLEIQVSGIEQMIFEIDAPGVEGFIIGRSDNVTNYFPDVDLKDASARELGVSRKHLALVRYQGNIHIVDLNSVNGSYLNGKTLSAHTPYALKSGDKLRLGNLILMVRKQGEKVPGEEVSSEGSE